MEFYLILLEILLFVGDFQTFMGLSKRMRFGAKVNQNHPIKYNHDKWEPNVSRKKEK